MKKIVRGISMHISADGVKYYVHYELEGTIEVSKADYLSAIAYIEKWEKELGKKEVMSIVG